MTKISSSDVRKVAQLARLELPDDQIELYTAQIEEILSYVDQLQEIDTKNVSPTTRAVEVVNAMREDLVDVKCLREDILNQAPHREGDFFRVPKIL
jgi:aspartyl-tRNA(Asn)/glutamyl-tRNA(Gln) amidotransferase subunit C|tara:strand:+ start:276 stop:563 length:288 start_codon:yes stop_codon:yes gene_type:complete